MFLRTFLVIALLLSAATASRAGTYVQFRTFWGDIDVELYDEDKPITVRNFLRYVQSGRYENLFFHRCPTNFFTGITDFVLQGGGFTITNWPANPGLSEVTSFGNIPNEFGVGRRFSNTYGTLAMAKLGGNTNSASSQWFFNLNNNVFLDTPDTNGYFTVFGRIVGRNSTNTLRSYQGLSLNRGILDLGGVFSTLPVTYFGPPPATFRQLTDYLEYVDISLLNVKVTPAANGREISWNSLNTNRYHVEFTTNLPPVWNLLIATNGIRGEIMRVTDPATTAPRRFYRVRVHF